jgi:hypothetical protein
MKTVNPISKKCWVCNNTKFLNQFENDPDSIDKHANICNECLEEIFVPVNKLRFN